MKAKSVTVVLRPPFEVAKDRPGGPFPSVEKVRGTGGLPLKGEYELFYDGAWHAEDDRLNVLVEDGSGMSVFKRWLGAGVHG